MTLDAPVNQGVLTLGAGIGDSATISEMSMLDAANTAFSATPAPELHSDPAKTASTAMLWCNCMAHNDRDHAASDGAPAGLRLTGAAFGLAAAAACAEAAFVVGFGTAAAAVLPFAGFAPALVACTSYSASNVS